MFAFGKKAMICTSTQTKRIIMCTVPKKKVQKGEQTTNEPNEFLCNGVYAMCKKNEISE